MPEADKNIIRNSQIPDSDALQFLLGKTPGWGLRWGTCLVAIIMLAVFIIFSFIKYPDNVVVRASLVTENAPARILADKGAVLSEFFISNGDLVDEGDRIAQYEAEAVLEDISKLKHWLQKEAIGLRTAKSLEQFNLSSLGKLGPALSSFERKAQKYAREAATDISQQKIEALKEQIVQLDELNNLLEKQELTLLKEIELVEANYTRKKTLYDQELISLDELEELKSKKLRGERQLENGKTNIVNNEIEKNQLRSKILDLQKNQTDLLGSQLNILQEDKKNILSEIQSWEQSFLVLSPKGGKINLPLENIRNKYFKQGELIATIVPEGKEQKVICKAKLPFANAGKVVSGSIASLRLDAYPYQEFGNLKAVVEDIALVPEGKNYELILSLPEGMTSNTGKQLQFRQEMQGAAFIKTEDVSITGRIFNKLVGALRNR